MEKKLRYILYHLIAYSIMEQLTLTWDNKCYRITFFLKEIHHMPTFHKVGKGHIPELEL